MDNDSQILNTLNEIKTEMIDARLEAKRIATLVEERNCSAIAFRDSVCKKFDRIFLWLEKLPCKERGERTKNQQIFDKLLWGAIGITFGILVVHLGWR